MRLMCAGVSPFVVFHVLVILAATVPLSCGCAAAGSGRPRVPMIVGPWWQVAGNPDLGPLTGPPDDNPKARQEPVDFAVWQAADGTWQLWSCIRQTKCGGKSRLLHRWEGRHLTDTDWTPLGVALQAEPACGETPGGMQAPHVIRTGDGFCMFYGDWVHICAQRSADGKTFERWRFDDGRTGLFDEGEDANARDAMVLRVGDEWFCYYTAFPGRVGAVYLRRSTDLRTWGPPKIVSRGGVTGSAWSSAECPHVVHVDGYYYLFRTQRYTDPPTTAVYRSVDPTYFGVDDDSTFVGLLPVAAPEVVVHDGQYYLAALLPNLQGIRIARLTWVPEPTP